jgi:hypothetical protein
MPLAGQPAGLRASQILLIPSEPAYERVRATVGAIEQVHGLGAATPAALRVELDPRLGDLGSLTQDRHGHPVRLALRPGPLEEIVFSHEFGHLLDMVVIGGAAGRASVRRRPDSRPVMDAIFHSRSYDELRLLRRQPSVVETDARGRRARFPVSARHVAYLLGPQEAWSRAYCQYIALRSGEPTLRAQIDRFRSSDAGNIYRAAQWPEADFGAIADAFDRMILDLGWRR